MIKLIVTILFKSSAAIKIIFLSLLHETRFLFKGFSDTYMIVAGIIAVIILLAHLVNLFLIYKFKSIGKAMYLVLFVITSLTYIAQGSFVYGPYDSLFGSLSWAVSGAILVFLYFTPIKYEFERGY